MQPERPTQRRKAAPRPAPPPAPPGAARQIAMLAPEGAALLHLVRANLELLREIASRYEVPWLPPDVTDADGRTIQCPGDVAGYLRAEMGHLAQEQLRAVLLNSKNRVIGVALVYQGSVNAAAFSGVGDCFREAIRAGAASIILAHNHPSGDPAPSPEDVRVTQEVAKAGELLGIEVLDHVVIGREGHVSLRERGLYLPPPLPTQRG